MPVFIVGAGLAGLATARALVDRNVPVIVLDAREGVGLETSFANAGMLTPSLPEPWNGPGAGPDMFKALFGAHTSIGVRPAVLPSHFAWGLRFLRNSSSARFIASTLQNHALAKYSLDKTLEVSRERRLDFDLSEQGSLCIFDSPGELEHRWGICERLSELGMTAERLTPDEVAEYQPSLGVAARSIAGGIRLPDDARGDAHRFCLGLAETILNDGGEIRAGINVETLCVDAGRVTALKTNAGTIAADRVVIAAGVHSPSLVEGVGLRVPVKPAKGFSITFEGIEQGEVPDVTVLDESSHAVVSTFGSRLRIAGMAEFCGIDKSIPRLRIDYLYGVLRKLLPAFGKTANERTATEWAGLRPMSADGRPLIGPTGIDGLYLNTGHGALGWAMAMGSGHLLADLVTGCKPETDPAPFLPASRY